MISNSLLLFTQFRLSELTVPNDSLVPADDATSGSNVPCVLMKKIVNTRDSAASKQMFQDPYLLHHLIPKIFPHAFIPFTHGFHPSQFVPTLEVVLENNNDESFITDTEELPKDILVTL
jgi:hypothetical protein